MTAIAAPYGQVLPQQRPPACQEAIAELPKFLFLKGTYSLGPWTVVARNEYERNVSGFSPHYVEIHTDYLAEAIFSNFKNFESRRFRVGSVDPQLNFPKCTFSSFEAVCFEEKAMRFKIPLKNGLVLRVAQKETLDMKGRVAGYNVAFKLFSERRNGFQMRLKSVIQTESHLSFGELVIMSRMFLVNSGNLAPNEANGLELRFDKASTARRMSLDICDKSGKKAGFFMLDKKAYSERQHFAPFKNHYFAVEAEYVGEKPEEELEEFSKYVAEIEEFLKKSFGP